MAAKNPWSKKDEKEHKKSTIEWWCIEAFLKDNKTKTQWNIKSSFNQWLKKSKQTGSNLIFTLIDMDRDKHYDYYSENLDQKLNIKNNQKNIHKCFYNDSFIKGFFPKYELFVKDIKNEVMLNIKCNAESMPRWISQDVTNGWLPMGLGFYRYGFIPKCKISGTLTINQKKFDVEGTGYYEHVWGDFSYTNWFTYNNDIRKSILTYAKLVKKWIQCNKPKIPKSLVLSTDNNPLGYDWAWIVFDNGWTLFYGNILGWIMKGPMFGTVILSKEGNNYSTFYNAKFDYKKIKYSKKYDIYYPTELYLNVKNNEEKLNLFLKSNVEPYEFLNKLTDNKNAYVIFEQTGTVNGFYSKGVDKTNLRGVCKFEPQRQLFNINHNSLKIDFSLPPNGLGFDIVLHSHSFRKKLKTSFHLYPKIKGFLDLSKLTSKDFDVTEVKQLY